ncbi:hypothetical protein CROQUDRAFT_575524 [Cronartium quercuum f. sp. fusiforme G11]|uniref:Uncharacterized protein n=1 Tax=Cronartium quercuum f. sp. fusiforme G11 TaxID=708437 RepID=A0A9P6NJW3_9BASI|nr:hypothetical protein CROQUDRAFT_575524 [Cronartium quercuum f. sp. fusiforme G11]
MANAVNEGNTDLIGLGRPACLNPHVASFILNSSIPKAICPTAKIGGVGLWNKLVPVKLIGIGFNTVWHAYQLQCIASGKEVDLKLSALVALSVILPSGYTLIKWFCYILLLLAIFIL